MQNYLGHYCLKINLTTFLDNMQQVLNLLDQFSGTHVLCIGDAMLDRFIYGKVERISPEAPIPIMKFDHFDEMK